jgi:hypothetical protein
MEVDVALVTTYTENFSPIPRISPTTGELHSEDIKFLMLGLF